MKVLFFIQKKKASKALKHSQIYIYFIIKIAKNQVKETSIKREYKRKNEIKSYKERKDIF